MHPSGSIQTRLYLCQIISICHMFELLIFHGFFSFRRRVHLRHLRILLCWLAKDLISYQWNSVKSLTWPTCFGWEFLFTWTIFVLFETLPLENLISDGSFLFHSKDFRFVWGPSTWIVPFVWELSIHSKKFRLVWNPSTWEPHFGWKLSYSLSLIWGFLFSWRTFVFFDTLSLEPLISVGRFLSHHLNDFRLVWNPSTETAPFVWEVRFDFHSRRFHLFEVSKTVWSQG